MSDTSSAPKPPLAERLLGDERLAKLAGKGDARAFGALYSRHHQAIYRYCRSILGNDHDAQDALQSAMMRAYAALARQERDLVFKAWLFRIAHNEAISILRRRRPEQELASELESATADVEGTLQTRERLAALVADLRSLPERQRAALLMRELSGLSIREIAGALSISEGAAKQTLFEARTSLHELSEGRTMECKAVREAISRRDGRVLRGRRLRAHLAACEDCRAFRETIAVRQADLRILAPPLPLVTAGAVLMRLVSAGSGQPGAAAGGAAASGSSGPLAASSGPLAASSGPIAASSGPLASGSGTSLVGHAAASLLVKGVAGVAVIAAATAGTVHLTSASRPAHPTSTSAGPQSGASAGHEAGARTPSTAAAAARDSAPVQAGEGKAHERGATSSGSADGKGGRAQGAGDSKAHPTPGRQPVGSSNPRERTAPAANRRRHSPIRGSRGRSEAHRANPHRTSSREHPGRARGDAKRTGSKRPPANHSKKSPSSSTEHRPSPPPPQPTGKATGEVQPPTVTQSRPARTSAE